MSETEQLEERLDATGGSPGVGMSEAGGVAVAAGPAVAPPSPTTGAGSGRLLSLDVFRGVTIVGMLLVNNPGSWTTIYGPLQHAEWHGWTPTDLIFPFFLFIVGVAMIFSFAKRKEQGADRARLLANIARRSLIIVGLGLVLHAYPWWDVDVATLRVPGVLQRIGVAYFFASLIVLYGGLRAQIVWVAALLLGYWALMVLVPVPGYGAGLLDAGATTLAGYLDRTILGTQHLWVSSETWDPEGILSTMPAIGTVLLGVMAGTWLRSRRTPLEKVVGLFLAGNVCLVLGLAWNAVFPINKPIWTSSYVIFTAGMALHFLAMCYWLVDVRGQRKWAMPFVYFGVNAITAFFLSGIMARTMGMIQVGSGAASTSLKGWTYGNLFEPYFSPMNASLAFAIAFVGFWLGVMTILYRRRIFIKI